MSGAEGIGLSHAGAALAMGWHKIGTKLAPGTVWHSIRSPTWRLSRHTRLHRAGLYRDVTRCGYGAVVRVSRRHFLETAGATAGAAGGAGLSLLAQTASRLELYPQLESRLRATADERALTLTAGGLELTLSRGAFAPALDRLEVTGASTRTQRITRDGLTFVQNAAFVEWPNTYRVYRVYRDRLEWEVRQVANRGFVRESFVPAKAMSWMMATGEGGLAGTVPFARPSHGNHDFA